MDMDIWIEKDVFILVWFKADNWQLVNLNVFAIFLDISRYLDHVGNYYDSFIVELQVS